MSDSPAETAKFSNRVADLEVEERELRDKWHEHWLLSLSIANGGATLLILDHIAKQEWTSIYMFWSSICFLGGLVLSGAGRLGHSKMHDRQSQRYSVYLQLRGIIEKKGADATMIELADPPLKRKVTWFRRVAKTAEAASAALFVLGCGIALMTGYAQLRTAKPTPVSCTCQVPSTVAIGGATAPPAQQAH